MEERLKKKRKNSFYQGFSEKEKSIMEKVKRLCRKSDYDSFTNLCKTKGFAREHAKLYAVGRGRGEKAKEFRKLISHEIGFVYDWTLRGVSWAVQLNGCSFFHPTKITPSYPPGRHSPRLTAGHFFKTALNPFNQVGLAVLKNTKLFKILISLFAIGGNGRA